MAKVLIVDDNLEHSTALAKVLEAVGHEVSTAPNGREALSQVMSSTPQVILLDLLMPEMDGPSFLEVVRSYLRLQCQPVIVLTGIPESPMVEKTRALNVNSILVKGRATSDDIQNAIQNALASAPA
jgi:CheY-like chemotaxis protein